jgi:hypothetical protein
MFDVKGFKKAKHKTRTADVPVPDLKRFFTNKKDKIAWHVRGLTGKEIGATKMAAAKNKSVTGLIEMLQSAQLTEKTEAMAAVMDLGKNRITDNIAERLDQMVVGSIKPKCDIDLAVKICERYPVDFYSITNEILKLTGLGMDPGEPAGCTKPRT